MYCVKSIALAVALSLPATFGSPTLGIRQNGVTCQTSDGSPVTGDVTLVINELKGRGGNCFQGNGRASDCTTLANQGGASIGVCGAIDDEDSVTSCNDIAEYANQIQQTCLNGDPGDEDTRTGGTFTISASKRVILF